MMAASRDQNGGETQTGVRWWIKWCVWGKKISPVRRVAALSKDVELQLEEEVLLMDFITWLVTCKPSGRAIKPETARKYVSQVQGWHRRHYGVSIGGNVDMFRLPQLVKGLRKQLGDVARKPRFGVRTQDLRKAIDRNLGSGSLEELAWSAALQTGFCALMRAGEFATGDNEGFDRARHLTRADLEFYRDEHGVLHAVLMMRPLKSERYRSKSVPIILAEGGSILDPVRALWNMVMADPVPEERREMTPLFRHAQGERRAFSVREVREMVKRLMQSLGLPRARFGAHSLRIGGATAALAANVDPSLIRLMGRWASDVYEIYTRLSREAVVRVGVQVGSTAFNDIERGFRTEDLEVLAQECTITDEDLDVPDEEDLEDVDWEVDEEDEA
jgi:hypothetical protein